MASSKKKKVSLGLNKGCFTAEQPEKDKEEKTQDDDDEFLTDTKNEQLIIGQALSNDICLQAFAQHINHDHFLIGNHQVIAFCINKAVEEDVQVNDDIFDVYRYEYPGSEKSTGGLGYISKLRKGYCENLTTKTYKVHIKKLKSDFVKYRVSNVHMKRLLNLSRDPSSKIDDIGAVSEKIDDLVSQNGELEHRGFKTMAELNVEHDHDIKNRKTDSFGHTGFRFLNEHLTEGFAQKRVSILAGRPGMCKCLTVDTPILLHDGSIKMVQDVEVGDRLMGPDSKPRNVMALVRGDDDLYRMVPKKGDGWGFNEAHIHSFRVSTNINKKFQKGDIHNMTIREYESLPKRVQTKLKLWRSGVEFEKKVLPFDPRWVGLWLGDGSRGKTAITNGDVELISYFESFAKEHGLVLGFPKPNESGCPIYSFSTYGSGEQHHAGAAKPNPLLDFCRSMVIGGEKRVPKEYLRSSYEQRSLLLAGLLDSDGYLTSGCFEITTKYQGLSNDILFLARSLGFAAYGKPIIATIKERDFKGVYFKIVISGEVSKIPCILNRRKAEPRKMRKNVLNVGFDYEPFGFGSYYGFNIDGDQLFMLGDFTVTHNSAFVANSMIRMSNNKIPNALFALEMDGPAMADRWNAIETGIPLTKLIKRHDLTKGNVREEERIKKLREDKPMYINDQTGKSLKDIRRDAKHIVDKYGVRVIFIDLFMKVVKPYGMNNKSTADTYTAMLNEIQVMARELNVHFSLVVQIGRQVEARTDKRPMISDLKDSGGFEEIADLILLFYRESYYLSKNVEDDFEVDLVEIIIGKQRQGGSGTVKAKFLGEITKIVKCGEDDEELFKKMLQIMKPKRGKKTYGSDN